MKPVAVLAGTHNQYRDWLYGLSLGYIPPRQLARIIHLVMCERDCYGAEFSTYFIIGTFWDRANAGRLIDITRSRIK